MLTDIYPEGPIPTEIPQAFEREKSLQKINWLMLGRRAGVFATGAATLAAGTYGPLQILADTKFHTLTGSISGAIANTTSGSAPTIPAGTLLYGEFTAVQIHSGTLIAYQG